MRYQAFKVEQYQSGEIIKVIINRPKVLNAMNPKFFQEIGTIFTQINKNQNVRVVILTGQGKSFTAGLDLKQYGSLFYFDSQTMEPARFGIKLYEQVRWMQRQFLSLIQCRVPVLIGIHNYCVGGGVDLISMGDIRYCTQDTKFTIKQVDIGMAADLGTLQILPNVIGNQSTFRQLAFTGRFLQSKQALSIGLVSKIFSTKSEMQQNLLNTAKIIASKSPVAIYTLKQIMKRQLYKKVYQSLQYMAKVNANMLLTKDTMTAISSFMKKQKPIFPKL